VFSVYLLMSISCAFDFSNSPMNSFRSSSSALCRLFFEEQNSGIAADMPDGTGLILCVVFSLALGFFLVDWSTVEKLEVDVRLCGLFTAAVDSVLM